MTRLKIFKDNFEKTIAVLTVLFSGWMAWYVHKLGLMLALTDQSAHLNFSKLVFKSLTPGISQLGFWPPLLHIVMIPFVSIEPLFTSGLAGFFALLPFLITGAIFIYRIVLALTNKKILGFTASMLFLLNPYILYYAVTPMSEILFIANLTGVAYFYLCWADSKRLRDLLLCGLFIALACLSRYEGLILIPLVMVIILLVLIKEKKTFHEIEAALILFAIPTIAGLIFILTYSWVYGGNLLTFSGGGWWIRSPLEETAIAKHNLILSFQSLLAASNYMFTKILVVIAIISFAIGVLFSSRRLILSVISLILFSPFLFDLLSLFNGVPLLIPEFPLPYKIFVNKILLPEAYLNERYGLYWIGFVVIIPIVLIGTLLQKTKSKLLNILTVIIISLFIACLISLSLYNLYNVSFVGKFKTIRYNLGVPSNEQIEAARYLNKIYDYGKILLTRVDNDPILVAAKIPLINYISEGNYGFYDQAVKQPWFFARWVIIYNQNDPQGDKWVKKKESLSVMYSDSEIFHKYYKLVFKNDKKIIYKINEDAIRKLAKEEKYNLLQIPSINPHLVLWDPETIYQEMNVPTFNKIDSELDNSYNKLK